MEQFELRTDYAHGSERLYRGESLEEVGEFIAEKTADPELLEVLDGS